MLTSRLAKEDPRPAEIRWVQELMQASDANTLAIKIGWASVDKRTTERDILATGAEQANVEQIALTGPTSKLEVNGTSSDTEFCIFV